MLFFVEKVLRDILHVCHHVRSKEYGKLCASPQKEKKSETNALKRQRFTIVSRESQTRQRKKRRLSNKRTASIIQPQSNEDNF
ncbi:hypothetical protein WN51_04469 [Melipona quadrifasciata]|uniref:Uncharacterized protein n=1 Tax=Melipona quadrifasciata TaxID=166423 RepID=A0A0N0BD51_9HYME|nr:hypothetical protein WN51_04469 [Melipona quadrifasciata]